MDKSMNIQVVSALAKLDLAEDGEILACSCKLSSRTSQPRPKR